jgi:hypothetical protein
MGVILKRHSFIHTCDSTVWRVSLVFNRDIRSPLWENRHAATKPGHESTPHCKPAPTNAMGGNEDEHRSRTRPLPQKHSAARRKLVKLGYSQHSSRLRAFSPAVAPAAATG